MTSHDFHQPWFNDPDTALESIVALDGWTTGTMMLFYLAALQSIPTDVYEAAARSTAASGDVLAHHVPAAQAGALLRRRRVGDRRAEDVRPGLHHLQRLRQDRPAPR